MHDNLLAEIRRRNIPALYVQENSPDPTIHLRFSLLGFRWWWFVTEAQIEPSDILFYGYVHGFSNEAGYFRLSELQKAGIPLIVDYGFIPCPLSEAKKDFEIG